MESITIDDLAKFHLNRMNLEIAEEMNGSCILIDAPMFPPLDTEFRVVVEGVIAESQSNQKNNHLIIILKTRGGVMETVERLVSIMRQHYKKISFVIPDYAFSAGTVLALSGDEIYMDYFSVLGPIDPQFHEGKKQLPGIGYLSKFTELKEKINQEPDKQKVQAEIVFLLEKFDPAQLFNIEQAVEHGQTLIKQWLPKYKFKDWKKTKTNGKKVNNSMRNERAVEIAKVLGDATKWHSHGRGISMQELNGEGIKLLIHDFEKEKFGENIRNYHDLCVDNFIHRRGMNGYIHSRMGVRRVF